MGVWKEGGYFSASYDSEKRTNIAVRSPIAEKKKEKVKKKKGKVGFWKDRLQLDNLEAWSHLSLKFAGLTRVFPAAPLWLAQRLYNWISVCGMSDKKKGFKEGLARRIVKCRALSASSRYSSSDLIVPQYTLLFQRVPTNDRGWVEFNNGANLGIRITKGTLERNRYHNSLVVWHFTWCLDLQCFAVFYSTLLVFGFILTFHDLFWFAIFIANFHLICNNFYNTYSF
jgi:hypothetical protein